MHLVNMFTYYTAIYYEHPSYGFIASEIGPCEKQMSSSLQC